jgi:hypothetical protein
MVEPVEGFEAELDAMSLGNPELLKEPQIVTLVAGVVEEIARPLG